MIRGRIPIFTLDTSPLGNHDSRNMLRFSVAAGEGFWARRRLAAKQGDAAYQTETSGAWYEGLIFELLREDSTWKTLHKLGLSRRWPPWLKATGKANHSFRRRVKVVLLSSQLRNDFHWFPIYSTISNPKHQPYHSSQQQQHLMNTPPLAPQQLRLLTKSFLHGTAKFPEDFQAPGMQTFRRKIGRAASSVWSVQANKSKRGIRWRGVPNSTAELRLSWE